MARVFHHDLWGQRQEKYAWLRDNDVASTEWEEIAPKSEFYLFVPRDERALDRYRDFPFVTEIFPQHSAGVKTHRDHFVIAFDSATLKRRIRQFRNPDMPDEVVRQTFGLSDNRDWKMAEKRKKIQEDEDWQEKIVQCLYRPFDVRWIFYHYHAIERGREEVMRHMLAHENVALCIGRAGQVIGPGRWDIVFCSTQMEDTNLFRRGGNVNFPLDLYPDTSKNHIFNDLPENGERRPNLHPRLLPALTEAYGFEPSPEDVFNYVYAVLYGPSYREKYAEFLKIDFPRVPFTADAELFRALAELGERLVALHLLDSPELDPPIARFEGEGDSRVARLKSEGFRYDADTERKYINEGQYFAPVPVELWEYQVGGYQVLHKWLKDRKERRLSVEEIRTYCRIVTALRRTIEAQEEIDALYPRIEEDIVQMHLGP